MKHACRLLGILDQRGKERRRVAGLNAAKDVQVKFEEILLVIENAAADP